MWKTLSKAIEKPKGIAGAKKVSRSYMLWERYLLLGKTAAFLGGDRVPVLGAGGGNSPPQDAGGSTSEASSSSSVSVGR